MNEQSYYDEFARDPAFPCPACPADGRRCRLMCLKYKLWAALDWINMQYNAGIISAEEKKVREENARKRYEEIKDV